MKLRLLKCIVVMLVALPIAANALTITQEDSFTGETLDFSRISTFNQFDTQGGMRTLNSVTLSVDFSIDSGYFIADNDSDQTAEITFTYAVTSNLTSTDVFISSAVGVGISDSVSLSLGANEGDVVGVIDPTPPDGATITPTTATFTATEVMSPAALASYIGTGTFDTTLASGRTFNIDGDSGVEGGFSNMDGSGKVSVIYDYTIVPEPATLAILGLGGLMIRRRRKS